MGWVVEDLQLQTLIVRVVGDLKFSIRSRVPHLQVEQAQQLLAPRLLRGRFGHDRFGAGPSPPTTSPLLLDASLRHQQRYSRVDSPHGAGPSTEKGQKSRTLGLTADRPEPLAVR